MKASEFLLSGAKHIDDRAKSRDCPGGERSMARTVAMFNAATGRTLNEGEGWLFMEFLKISRSLAGEFNADDYEDCAAYAALRGECDYGLRVSEVNLSSTRAGQTMYELPGDVGR